MSETNGHEKSRLDRIEDMIERGEQRNQEAHARFEAEYQHLAAVQAMTSEHLERLLILVENMAEETARYKAAREAADARLDLKMEETTEKLNALIETVDGTIRRPPAQ